MKKECVLLFVLCFLVLTVSPSRASSADVVAERPVYSLGDYWIFIGGKGTIFEWRFVREEDNRCVFSKDGSEFAKDFSLMDTDRAGGSPGPIVRFPLKKGNWWNYEYVERSDTAGYDRKIIARYEVTDYKEVAVSAGKFWAFEITVDYYLQLGKLEGQKVVFSGRYWYAPDVKQIIKANMGERRWELKEYKVK